MAHRTIFTDAAGNLLPELRQTSLANYMRMVALLGAGRGESLYDAAHRVLRHGGRRRARRAARTMLRLGGWPGINQAVGYRRPDRGVHTERER